MCSILSVIDLRPGSDLSLLRPLALSQSAKLRHRGPDWSGVHAESQALLVHERLAIVDPAGGSQPLYSEDGALVLAVNGSRTVKPNRRSMRLGTPLGVATPAPYTTCTRLAGVRRRAH